VFEGQKRALTHSSAHSSRNHAQSIPDLNINHVTQVALMGNTYSKDGSLMAYALSSGGSDWRRVKFLELDLLTSSYTEMPDTLNHVKFSSMAWSHDHKCVAAQLRSGWSRRKAVMRRLTRHPSVGRAVLEPPRCISAYRPAGAARRCIL
jgi:prolyl oligopeptidase PreP (S9A serine peptidase family)